MAFGDERELQIVLKARDEASKTIQQVGEETSGLSDLVQRHYQAAAVAATGLIGALAGITKSAVENAASYEQNRIAFESMLGSADKARTLLKEVSDFAQKTPFELPQVVQGSRQLLAYGIEAKNIIPTFKTLGDIASGVGTDKMPNLIMAFGQVKAATKLTGMELRQFTEAGVPLLDALVKKANEGGGALVTMGGGAKKAKVDVGEVTERIGILNQKMAENHEKYKEGSVAYRQAQLQLKNYNDQLATASQSQGTFTRRVKVTKEEMIDLISKGKISFDQVQAALEGMTTKGGLFFQGMERQSKTFNGVMSNVSDSFGKFVREVVGISDTGDIRKGSLFEALKNGAERLLVVMEQVRPQIVAMANAFSQNQTAIAAVAGAIGGLLVLAIGAAVIAFGPAIAVMLAFAAAGAAVAGGIVYLNTTYDLFKTKQDLVNEAQRRAKDAIDAHWLAVKNLDDAIKGLSNSELNLEGAQLAYERAQRNLTQVTRQYGAVSLEARDARYQLRVAEEGVRDAMDQVNKKLTEAQQKHDAAIKSSKDIIKAEDDVTQAVNRHATAWDGVLNGIKGAFDWLNKYVERTRKDSGGKGISVPFMAFAEGTSFAPGGLALVGERGPELVNIPRGSQVIPNRETRQIFNNGGNINIAAVYVRSEGDIYTLSQQLAFQMKTRGNL